MVYENRIAPPAREVGKCRLGAGAVSTSPVRR